MLTLMTKLKSSLHIQQLQKTEIILSTQYRLVSQPSGLASSTQGAECIQTRGIQELPEHGDPKSENIIPADRTISFNRRRPRYHKREKTLLVLRTPPWLTSRVWEICVTEACCGWTLGISTHNIRPFDAPAFRCIQCGELQRLQQLFDKGESSPFDRDTIRRSLLHVMLP